MRIPDSIEREVILPVPPARVWAALTQADQLGAWFGTQATIDLRPGGDLFLPGTVRQAHAAPAAV